MQEEVKKHTKKIYNAMKNPKHTFADKIKEVSIEIFIIVFAVTLSIWLHSWSEKHHQREEAKESCLLYGSSVRSSDEFLKRKDLFIKVKYGTYKKVENK